MSRDAFQMKVFQSDANVLSNVGRVLIRPGVTEVFISDLIHNKL